MLVTFLGIQWPFSGSEEGEVASGDRRLFEGGRYFHPDQKARFTFDSPHQRKDGEHHLLQFDVKPAIDAAAEASGDVEPRGLREPPPEWAAARIVLLLNPVDADFWSLTERESIRLEDGAVSPAGGDPFLGGDSLGADRHSEHRSISSGCGRVRFRSRSNRRSAG